MHNKVLVVNIDSFKSHHVKTGKVKYDIPNPSMRADHASPVVSTAKRTPYQKQMLAGTPNKMAGSNALFSHHLHT
jgi:hypothetical protein